MAQGLLKKASKTAGPKRNTTLGPKPGPRSIAPKKASLIKQKKLTKKVSAGLTAMTELSLASKAGHLELLAGGKRDKKNAAAKAAKAAADKKAAGGK